MQTRSGKIYGTPSLKERIDMLKIELNKKIEYNLKNGIYGQTAYIDDYALIEYLEEQYTLLNIQNGTNNYFIKYLQNSEERNK